MSQAPGTRSARIGWCFYDWANSAYATTVMVGLLPRYFAEAVIPPGGMLVLGRPVAADTLWGVAVGTATLLTFLLAPVLGAVADFTAAKKRFLLGFAWTGSLFTVLLWTCRGGDVTRTLGFFLLTQICFIAANVFYDAFLPHLAEGAEMDRLSAQGYAWGYVGGGLQFALSLLLVSMHDRVGLSLAQAVRIGIVAAGVWWGGFTLVTARLLREPATALTLPERYRGWPRALACVAVGVSRTLRTTRRVSRMRHLLIFLVAFMLYDDAIQTVISMASIYGTVELHLPTTALMLTLLLVQAVALVGALIFARLAGRIGARHAVMVTLVIWIGVVLYAYFIRTPAQFFVLGGLAGLVMGGSQALSRSLYGSMIPVDASAEFYGFYTVFSKFSAIWGPFTFAAVKQVTGSSRLAIVSLVVLFVIGLALLSRVDEAKARAGAAAG